MSRNKNGGQGVKKVNIRVGNVNVRPVPHIRPFGTEWHTIAMWAGQNRWIWGAGRIFTKKRPGWLVNHRNIAWPGSIHDTDDITYRCFLPDLTRFMTFCYAATDQNTHGQFDTAQPGNKIYTSNSRVLQGKFYPEAILIGSCCISGSFVKIIVSTGSGSCYWRYRPLFIQTSVPIDNAINASLTPPQ